MANTGLGTTITFTGFVGTVRKVSSSGASVKEIIDTTNFATSDSPATQAGGNVTKIPNGLVDAGTVTVEGFFDSVAVGNMAVVGSEGTLTIAFAPPQTSAGTWNWSADAILKEFTWDAPHDNVMTFTAVFELSDNVTSA